MSRRKKPSADRGAACEPGAPPDRATPQPNPPRPNKWFLLIAGILLAVWITFLLVLAVAT